MNVWWQALRPKTLGASIAPVLVGAAHAHFLGPVSITLVLLAMVAALLLQIGTNFANDYFDFRKGADNEQRAGPPRAVAAGLLKPEDVVRAAAVSFLLAALVGVYLSIVGGWPIFVIGATGLLMGYAYTAGPFPLAYKGLGDIVVFLYFGPLATMGMEILLLGSVSLSGLLVGVPLGLLAAAILLVNNVRDRPTDAPVGKNTLVVRLGDMFGVVTYLVTVASAFGIAMVLAVWISPWMLLPLLALPLARDPINLMTGDLEPRAKLNPALGMTNRMLLAFSLLLSLSFLFA